MKEKIKESKGKKHAQITVFIIIAIVIVVVIALLFIVFKNNLNSNNVNNPQNYFNSCFEKTGEQALFYIGQTGGYYNIPAISTEYGNTYYFYENKNLIPSKERIQSEVDNFMEDFGRDCANNFSSFYNIISLGNLTSKTVIYDDKIDIQIDYPITIEEAGKRVSFENFNIKIPGRVGTVYNAASEYIDYQMENPRGICISCMNDISNKYNVNFITFNYDNETIIFDIYDNNTKINNMSYYVYSFATKYDLNESNFGF
jgi:hypothetical protein